MHTELEDFLNEAFSLLQPASSRIGRVVVEPDYDAQPNNQEGAVAAEELCACISHLTLTDESLSSRAGVRANINDEYAVLKKYVRSITLHADTVEGAWVEVAPPGNWI